MEVREALIQYLQNQALPVPEVIDSAPKQISDQSKDGFVTPGFSHGVAFVKDSSGKLIRLAWVPTKENSKKLRALPPGTYALKGYRLMQKDDMGKSWHISTTSPAGIGSFTIEPGSIYHLAIPSAIHIHAKGGVRKRTAMVQASIAGEKHSGLSIYKNGNRIPMAFTISDPTGEELEKGAMKYG